MIDRGLRVAGIDTSLHQMAEDARRAEAAGMDSVYCVEAYRGGLSTVAAIAAATERIRVGPYVLNADARTSSIANGPSVCRGGPGFSFVSDSSEGVDRGDGTEPVRQAIPAAPGTSTILALTHADSL
jgi:hypothetical protein